MNQKVKRTLTVPEELDAVVLGSMEPGEEFAGQSYTYAAVELMRRGSGMPGEKPISEETAEEIIGKLGDLSNQVSAGFGAIQQNLNSYTMNRTQWAATMFAAGTVGGVFGVIIGGLL